MKLLKLLTSRLKFLPVWVPTALILGAILWLTLAPQPTPDLDIPLFPGIDKVAHALMFFALALTLWFDCGRRGHIWRSPAPRICLLCAAASLATGILIEWLQRAMGLGRSFEWLDMAADSAGCLLALLLMLAAGRKS